MTISSQKRIPSQTMTSDGLLPATGCPLPAVRRRFFEPQWLFLVLLVGGGYFAALTLLPLAGEETRRATCAIEMIRTGEWIVHQQQGTVYLSRPPLGSWAIAVVGLLRGDVDAVAIRLPSALATLLTTLLVYWYTRRFASPLAALAAGCAFATCGQTLELGRLGESEALFTLFVAASLLVWHVGYTCGWQPLATWTAGYALAALAALIKGPQAPVYFVGAVGVYLLVRRDWRKLLSPAHVAGVLVFVFIVGCWQAPYLLRAGWHNTWLTWFGLAMEKATDHSLPRHVATYPFEVLASLLPWSVWLPILLTRRSREALSAVRPVTGFLLVCLLVTFPTVWFASAAKARYFMPLYPCIAVLVGLAIERSATAARGSSLAGHWRRYLVSVAVVAAVAGVAVGILTWGGSSILNWGNSPRLEAMRPAPSLDLFVMAACALGAALQWISLRRPGQLQSAWAVAGTACLMALFYAGVIVPSQARQWRDGHLTVAPAKALLPANIRLTSFDPVHHWFVYHMKQHVPVVPWPRSPQDVPDDVDYFCFDWHQGDSPQQRTSFLGQQTWHTPGTLPFAWEEIARVPCDRKLGRPTSVAVVIGRVLRGRPPTTVAETPATTPTR